MTQPEQPARPAVDPTAPSGPADDPAAIYGPPPGYGQPDYAPPTPATYPYAPGGHAPSQDQPVYAQHSPAYAPPADTYAQQPAAAYAQQPADAYAQPAAAYAQQPVAYGYQPPGYAQPAYGYPPYGYPVSEPTNGLSIAALVVSIVGAVGLCVYGLGGYLGIVGAILGHVATRQIRERGGQGAGMAKAGVIVGWIATGIAVLATVGIVFFVVWASGQPPSTFE
jgi:hypothetical protein